MDLGPRRFGYVHGMVPQRHSEDFIMENFTIRVFRTKDLNVIVSAKSLQDAYGLLQDRISDGSVVLEDTGTDVEEV
jgi:hypothetical protein